MSPEGFRKDTAHFIVQEIESFVCNSPENRMPSEKDWPIFDKPLVKFADGDDPIFAEYKKIIASTHLTPREALAQATDRSPAHVPERLSVISWILPITEKTRQSNRADKQIPSRQWSHTRWHGEKFNDSLRRHLVEVLTGEGHCAVAPVIQPYFKVAADEQGPFSNWSERHVAYAAGHGTFSLSDGFITERGIAHRCGSVVTDVALPVSLRIARSPYSNCLFYADGSCTACIARCPAGAITEKGHNKIKCRTYVRDTQARVSKEYNVGIAGCGLCQVKVPCESRNPVKT